MALVSKSGSIFVVEGQNAAAPAKESKTSDDSGSSSGKNGKAEPSTGSNNNTGGGPAEQDVAKAPEKEKTEASKSDKKDQQKGNRTRSSSNSKTESSTAEDREFGEQLGASGRGSGAGTDTGAPDSGLGENPAFSGYSNSAPSSAAEDVSSVVQDAFEAANSVFSYDETVYDSEIKSYGICSTYPVILGQLPITNLYKGGDSTNLGAIYEIQNSLVDASVTRSNLIVENYYSSNPAAQTELSQIRDQNNTKYNSLLSIIKNISGYRRQTINSIYIEHPNSTNIYDSTVTSKSTSAELAAAINAGPDDLVDADNGDFGNLSIVYVDDDVDLYDSGKNSFDALVENLIGDVILNGSQSEILAVQTRTTSQYQLMKAAFAKVLEGKSFTFGNISSNPYIFDSNTLDVKKVKPIYNVLSGESDAIHSTSPKYVFAKETLAECAKIIGNNFVVNTSKYSSESEIETFTAARSIDYRGILYKKKESGSIFTYIPSDFSYDKYEKIYDTSDELPSTGLLPFSKYDNKFGTAMSFNSTVVALSEDALSNNFMKQVPVALASAIMQSEAGSGPSLSSAINPTTESSVDISSTTGDEIRYVANLSNGQKIYLFDETLSADTEEEASPLSQIFLLNSSQLQELKTQVDQIDASLDSSLQNNRRFLSNQCALTIISTFYKYFTVLLNGYFPESPSSDHIVRIRAILLCLAAKDPGRAGIIYRMLHFNDVFRDWSGCSSESDVGEYLKYLMIPLTTDRGQSGTSDFDDESLSSTAAIVQNQIKAEVDTDDLKYSAKEIVEKLIPESADISETFTNIADYIASRYTSIEKDSELYEQIRFAAYSMFLYFLRKMNITYEFVYIDSEKRFRGFVKYELADIKFVVDSMKNCFLYTDASGGDFDSFEDVVGDQPTEVQRETGNTNYFRYIRGPIRESIQTYQDIRSLFAYQRTVLQTMSNSLASLIFAYSSLESLYTSDPEKASLIAGRYLTDESVIEAIYRASRYQKIIPGTGITSIATRSNNYRSIVRSVFKDLVPSDSNYNVAIVGIPYGLISRLREATEDRKDYFGLKLFSDDVRTVTDDQNEIQYSFPYISISESSRPELGGPHSIFVAGIYDDFDQNEEVSSAKDNGIALMKVESDFSKILPLYRDETTENFKNIDFPAILVQAAIESYLENVYGLYPRYAVTKGQMSSSYPEEAFANGALSLAGIDISTEEGALIFARLKSTIMFHKDFVTSRMLEELESSPAFEKIMYVLYNSENVENILTEFYARVEV